MKTTVELKFKGGMAFDALTDGHTIPLDASADFGGADSGARPKKLLLAALGGCTGIDVVSILNKMKVEFSDFTLTIEAVQNTTEHPHVYDGGYKIIYHIKLQNPQTDSEKVHKAVTLSQDKYCGVSAILKESAPVTYQIEINK